MDKKAILKLFTKAFPGRNITPNFFDNINTKMQLGYNYDYPLAIAISENRDDLVDILISLGADVNLLRPSIINDIMDNSNFKILRSLLDAGMEINTRFLSRTIRESINSGVDTIELIDIFKIFLSYGININHDDGNIKSTILFHIIKYSGQDSKLYQLAEFLFANGMNFSRAPYPFIFMLLKIIMKTILTIKEKLNFMKFLKLLIEYCISIDIHSYKMSCLYLLASNNEGEYVEDFDDFTLLLLMGRPYIDDTEKNRILPWLHVTNKIKSINYMIDHSIITPDEGKLIPDTRLLGINFRPINLSFDKNDVEEIFTELLYFSTFKYAVYNGIKHHQNESVGMYSDAYYEDATDSENESDNDYGNYSYVDIDSDTKSNYYFGEESVDNSNSDNVTYLFDIAEQFNRYQRVVTDTGCNYCTIRTINTNPESYRGKNQTNIDIKTYKEFTFELPTTVEILIDALYRVKYHKWDTKIESFDRVKSIEVEGDNLIITISFKHMR